MLVHTEWRQIEPDQDGNVAGMARTAGRPPNPTVIDGATMAAVRGALLDVARELKLPRRRYLVSKRSKQLVLQPPPLDLAVLAVKAAQALELVAAEHVARARELDGLSWAQVGDAFGVSTQSAYSRFHRGS